MGAIRVVPAPQGGEAGAKGRRQTTGDAGRGCDGAILLGFVWRGGRNLSTAGRAVTPGAGGLFRCPVRPRSPVRAEASGERPRRHL